MTSTAQLCSFQSIMEFYNYLFYELADPRVKDWIFFGSPFVLLGIIALYLHLVCLSLPKFMENREPYDLKRVLQCYNVIQIVLCTYFTLGFASIVYIDKFNWLCQPANFSNEDPIALKSLNLLCQLTFLKMFEFVETIFFVLRKKQNQVSKLHLYHHSTTYICGWVMTKYYSGGSLLLSPIINSFVHIVMYIYYFLAALSPEMAKKVAPWKSKLTTLQMVQLTIIFLHSFHVYRKDCPIPNIIPIMFIPNIVILLSFFYNFYATSYKNKHQSASDITKITDVNGNVNAHEKKIK